MPAEKKITDKQILQALKDFKALPISSLAVYLGVKEISIRRRLYTLLQKKMIYSKSIPYIHTKTGFRFFDGYQGMKMFSVSEDDFKKWIQEHLPKKISTLYKRSLSHYLSNIGITVELPESCMKIMIYISNDLYKTLEKKARKKKMVVSKYAEEIMREKLGLL